MPEVQLSFYNALRDEVTEWENSLEANYDDLESVDGEEGDYGIIRYYGPDVHGNKNVHLATKYVYGGDHEESFYTEAGAAVVQIVMQQNFGDKLRASLESSIDKGVGEDGMYHGWKSDMEKASELGDKQGIVFGGTLHKYSSLFPATIEHNTLYRFGYKFYVAVKNQPVADAEPVFYFYNILDQRERLGVQLLNHVCGRKWLFFERHYDSWKEAACCNKISSVVIDDIPITHDVTPMGKPL